MHVKMNRVLHVVDYNFDSVISLCQLREWLFPKTSKDYARSGLIMVLDLYACVYMYVCMYVCE